MNKTELLQLNQDLCAKALIIMKMKNQDYTAGSDDPFFNFRGAEARGIDAELGLILRMDDKINRIIAFIKNGELAVPDEGIIDIGCDLINYSVLVTGLMIERLERITGTPFEGIYTTPAKQETVPHNYRGKPGKPKKKSARRRAKKSEVVGTLIPDKEKGNDDWE